MQMNQYSNSILIKKKADELEMQEIKRINDEVIIILINLLYIYYTRYSFIYLLAK